MTAVESRITSSGTIASPYLVLVRSAITEVVRLRRAPSVIGKGVLAVESPQVGPPKDLVSARPRNATTIASPELAVGPAITATLGRARRTRYGTLRCTIGTLSTYDSPSEYPQTSSTPSGSMQ